MLDHSCVVSFRAAFPGIEPIAVARAPGRVNLIGEHIDYNNGIVLPIAIDLATRVVIGRAGDGRIRARSAFQPDELNYAVMAIPECAGNTWDAYVRGVAAALSWRGIRLPGCAMWIESDVPPGAGLSSSAALEVGVALALLAAAGKSMPMRSIADLCREAEHRFAGVPCGIMDQYACALARQGHALAIDCRDKSVRHVPWPAANPAVLIVDTGIERKLSSGAYEQRVKECGAALSAIQAVDSSIMSWRDVTASHLAKAEPGLSGVLRRRARHVVSEIERTQEAIVAMQTGDVSKFGKLMNASHASLSADYDVSLPAIDELIERLRGQPGVYGAKLTGAGFGGCVVALVDRAALGPLQSHASGVSLTDQAKILRSYPVGVAAGAEVVNLSAPPSQS